MFKSTICPSTGSMFNFQYQHGVPQRSFFFLQFHRSKALSWSPWIPRHTCGPQMLANCQHTHKIIKVSKKILKLGSRKELEESEDN